MKKLTLKEKLAEAVEENNWLKIEIHELKYIVNPPPPPPTHMDLIQEAEKYLNEEVNRLAQKCYDNTGVIPTIQIFINDNGVTYPVPTVEFKIDSQSYQTDAVAQLIKHCQETGSWSHGCKGENELRRWLKVQIRSHLGS